MKTVPKRSFSECFGKKGLTLIELLVVILVIGILTSIVAVNISGAVERARISKNLQFQSSIHALIGIGVIGHWRFNELTQGTLLPQGSVIRDSSGYGRDAFAYNGVRVSEGITGCCSLEFDGDDSYVRSPEVLGAGTQYTVSVWIKPRDLTPKNSDHVSHGFTILSEDTSDRYVLWIRVLADGNMRVNAFTSGTTGESTDDLDITEGQWHHIALTAVKGGSTVLYVNGEKKLSYDNPGTSGDWTGNFYIGELRAGRKIVFDGFIEDVRVYSKILTADEISRYYARSKEYFVL